MRRLMLPLVLLAFVAAACSVSFGHPSAADSAQNLSLPPLKPTTVEAVVQRVLPAVVNVTTDIFQPDQYGGAQQGQGVGTGFIVRSDGIVVTNCHVVEGATRITVATSAAKPQKYDAHVIGGDCQHDLAVLKIDATGLPTVQLGSSADVQLGQTVVALGYALALQGGPSVTDGIVSSLNRTIQVRDPSCKTCQNFTRTYSDIIQTDAAINHGNSGGPLVDLAGRVVGINSAGVDSAQSIGFAIAIDSAKPTIAQAESNPVAPTGYLGVLAQSVTPNSAAQFNLPVTSGAYILAVTPGSAADQAGMQQGEVIVSVNGQTITSADASGPQTLGGVLAGLNPGQHVPVEVVTKDGSHHTYQVTLVSRPLPTNLP